MMLILSKGRPASLCDTDARSFLGGGRRKASRASLRISRTRTTFRDSHHGVSDLLSVWDFVANGSEKTQTREQSSRED